MREKFEKFLGLEVRLKDGSIIYQEDKGRYRTSKLDASFINGAWYAYQEQQKKIDDAKEIIKHWHTWPCELKYGGNLMLDQLHKIEELLK